MRPGGGGPGRGQGAVAAAGIESQEARQVAEAAGLTVVMDRCMGATHGELGLGPGPD